MMDHVLRCEQAGFLISNQKQILFAINDHLDFSRRHSFPDQCIGNPEVMTVRSSLGIRENDRERLKKFIDSSNQLPS
jgi:hypothetical protein